MDPATPLSSLHLSNSRLAPSRSPCHSPTLQQQQQHLADGFEEVEVLQERYLTPQEELNKSCKRAGGGARKRALICDGDPAVPRGSPPSYFAYQPTSPVSSSLSPPPRQSLERGRSLPNLARRFSLKPSARPEAMDEAPRKQKSALGFSSIFGKAGSTSSRKKPPAPLTLTDILRPHPQAPARREDEDRSPITHTHRIEDSTPSHRRPPRSNQLQLPHSARSAYAAMLAPRQQEQIELEGTLWAQLPVSAPPYRRWEGQRVEVRRGSRASEWEVDLQQATPESARDEEGRRPGIDWRRGYSDVSLPFDISPTAVGSPTTAAGSPFLDAPRPTAAPLDPLTPTRPALVSAFSTDTNVRLSTACAFDTPPDSRPTSYASHSPLVETPSIYLRRPSVPDSPESTKANPNQPPHVKSPPPPPLPGTSSSFSFPPTRPLFSSDGSLSSDSHGSSWQGSSLEAEGSAPLRSFDSMSFSQVLSQSLAAVSAGGVAPKLGDDAEGLEGSVRESGGMEEFEQEAEFPWSGSGSLAGSGSGCRGSEDRGRRREDPLSREDWRQLEDLVAEQTEQEAGRSRSSGAGSDGSRSSKKSRRRGMFVSPAASLSGIAPYSVDGHRTTPKSCDNYSPASSSPAHTPHYDHRIPLPRHSPSSPSTSRHVAHPPRSPGIQPLHLLRRHAPRSSSIHSGFSKSTASSSSTDDSVERFNLPRQSGWMTGLDKLASLEDSERGVRFPLVRKRSASAPECREQRQEELGAEMEATTRSASTQTMASDLVSPPSKTKTPQSTSASTNGAHTSLDTLPNVFFSLPSSSNAFTSSPLAPESLSALGPSSCTPPSSTSSNVTAFELDSSSTDLELDRLQSAEVVDVVRSPVGSPTISRGVDRGRGEVRSMARASLLPLRKTGSSSAPMREGSAGMRADGVATSHREEAETTVDEMSVLRERNRVLEVEVSRLRAALGMEASSSSTESL